MDPRGYEPTLIEMKYGSLIMDEECAYDHQFIGSGAKEKRYKVNKIN